MPDRVTVLGAGVSGLTTGVVLAEAGHEVVILAADVATTTSAAAAAIWLPYHIAEDEHVAAWAETTREVLVGLTGVPEAGVSLIDFDVFGERLYVPLADTTRYLPYLRARFERAGGRVEVREVRREDLAQLEGIIVNCTGFGARALFGDDELQPGYGVAVVVPRPPIDYAIVRDTHGLMYVIPRATDCVLGGYDAPVPPPVEEVGAIVARCRATVPELSGEILAVRHGIRPVRPSVRLERVGNVIHNYGHGGAGFTVSWGCALAARRLR